MQEVIFNIRQLVTIKGNNIKGKIIHVHSGKFIRYIIEYKEGNKFRYKLCRQEDIEG